MKDITIGSRVKLLDNGPIATVTDVLRSNLRAYYTVETDDGRKIEECVTWRTGALDTRQLIAPEGN